MPPSTRLAVKHRVRPFPAPYALLPHLPWDCKAAVRCCCCRTAATRCRGRRTAAAGCHCCLTCRRLCVLGGSTANLPNSTSAPPTPRDTAGQSLIVKGQLACTLCRRSRKQIGSGDKFFANSVNTPPVRDQPGGGKLRICFSHESTPGIFRMNRNWSPPSPTPRDGTGIAVAFVPPSRRLSEFQPAHSLQVPRAFPPGPCRRTIAAKPVGDGSMIAEPHDKGVMKEFASRGTSVAAR